VITKRTIQLVSGALFLLIAGLSGARAAVPVGGVLDFAIVRNGKEIGTHVYRFREAQEGLQVDVQTRIQFKLGFVTVHRFNHDSHETWKDGRLIAFSSASNEKNIVKGRAKFQVAVLKDEGDLDVHAAKQEWRAPADAIPASLWNRKFGDSNTLIDTVDGAKLAIEVEALGRDVISVNGRQVAAVRYRLSGDLQRDLWYDMDDVLVQVRFTAEDGSEVRYIPR
jgi:hypothetical protein